MQYIFPSFQHGKIMWCFRPILCFPMHALPASDSPVHLFQHINFFLFFYFHCLFTRRRRQRDNKICICLVKRLILIQIPIGWKCQYKKNHSSRFFARKLFFCINSIKSTIFIKFIIYIKFQYPFEAREYLTVKIHQVV